MMLHPLVMAVAVACLVGSVAAALAGGPWRIPAIAAALLLAALTLERLASGLMAARRFRTLTPLMFPILHLGRDLAWMAAIAMWSARAVCGRPSMPCHSMRSRTASTLPMPGGKELADRRGLSAASARSTRVLCLIPAHNEAASLQAVIAELRIYSPDLDLLVIDDGSSDGTEAILEGLDVRWLHFPERMGIGGAMRAGLRYAGRLGYDAVVRLDGDGQHRAEDIDRLLAPIRDGRADVALGTRYAEADTDGAGLTRFAQRLLAACLSTLTRGRVTDPTSGFCAVGPRAVRMLAEHYPTGYPEAELRLFLNRNALNVIEVPVRSRSRLGGRTSLTTARLTTAAARVALAMIIVPFRSRVGEPDGD
jgi:hypothetical protein